MVRKAGLEPARLSAPPPQDGVSANSTTSAQHARSGTSWVLRQALKEHVLRPVQYSKHLFRVESRKSDESFVGQEGERLRRKAPPLRWGSMSMAISKGGR